MLFAKPYKVVFPNKRLAARIDIDIRSKLLALADYAVQLIKGKVQLVAVFRRPAARAMQIAGGGGVHKYCPRYVAAVFFLIGYRYGRAYEGGVYYRALYQCAALPVVNIRPQAFYQIIPVAVLVLYGAAYALDLIRHAVAILIAAFKQVKQLWNVIIGILVDIAVHLLHSEAFHCIRCFHLL